MATEPQTSPANQTEQHIGLASASPRRHALLRALGLTPVQLAVGIDEDRRQGEPIDDYVARMACEKALLGAGDAAASDLPVLAGDTVVSLGDVSYGKPTDGDDATRMLTALSGRTHQVTSGVALMTDQRMDVRVVKTDVEFRVLNDQDIRDYIATGEPFGKAGAYAIQGLGGTFVCRLAGSYSSVVGLPVFETVDLLRSAGIDVLRIAAHGGNR